MKPHCLNQRNQALTITEVLVVVAAVCVIAGLAYLTFHRTKVAPRDVRKEKVFRINCVNNLKQDILAYKIWANDNGDKYPQQIPVEKDGAMEEAERGNIAPIFQVMSNELSTPKILVCPADAGRVAAQSFTRGFDNSHISYFASLSASDDQPMMILIGDDNFTVGGKSAKSGLLEFSMNAPISWTPERHRNASNVGTGNIGLADGSVQEMTTEGLRKALVEAGIATNRLAIP